jgi:hypothetical protein
VACGDGDARSPQREGEARTLYQCIAANYCMWRPWSVEWKLHLENWVWHTKAVEQRVCRRDITQLMHYLERDGTGRRSRDARRRDEKENAYGCSQAISTKDSSSVALRSRRKMPFLGKWTNATTGRGRACRAHCTAVDLQDRYRTPSVNYRIAKLPGRAQSIFPRSLS